MSEPDFALIGPFPVSPNVVQRLRVIGETCRHCLLCRHSAQGRSRPSGDGQRNDGPSYGQSSARRSGRLLGLFQLLRCMGGQLARHAGAAAGHAKKGMALRTMPRYRRVRSPHLVHGSLPPSSNKNRRYDYIVLILPYMLCSCQEKSLDFLEVLRCDG